MYNKVIMIGNITKDIDLKYMQNGNSIAKSSIATTHKYKTQSGEQKEEVCFIDFTVFGKSGEILNQYAQKGSKVMLEGKLVFEQWKAQDGTNRSKHALKVSEFKFLDTKKSGNTQQAPQGQYQQQQQQYGQQQQGYNPQVQKQVQQVKQQVQQKMQQQVPTIDIDNEIPF